MGYFQGKKILVPVDFSESSLEAIKQAILISEDPALVTVVHVMVPLDLVSPGVLFGGLTDEKRTEHVQKYAKEEFAKHQIEGVTFETLVGDPGIKIADFAKEKGTDLIVIPSHGYSGLTRLALGSVAERVLRHSPCPTLVLRQPKK
ncbi:universal stress protein [uncultured Gimesia sp.]|jgi:nucleotide-binding universal stress UspA family protein|uniref:universal stress protein n=1 Tax=uncultured Gimesia sp. TaxID=1678688 RepID=UPI002621E4EE|nr:universal stress protein [uncultured Gimesia sp.]